MSAFVTTTHSLLCLIIALPGLYVSQKTDHEYLVGLLAFPNGVNPTWHIYVTNRHYSNITVDVSSPMDPDLRPTPAFFPLSAGSSMRVTVNNSLDMRKAVVNGSVLSIVSHGGAISVQAFSHIESTETIPPSTIGYRVSTVSSLSRNYVLLTDCRHKGRCVIAVMACHNHTDVTVTLALPGNVTFQYEKGEYGHGDVVRETLPAFGLLLLMCLDCDFSGTRVTSSKRVSVLTAAHLTQLTGPSGQGEAFQVTEVTPRPNAGDAYVLTSSPGRDVADTVQVMALNNGITFSFRDSVYTATMDRQIWTFPLAKGQLHFLTSDGPLVVSQFHMNTQTNDSVGSSSNSSSTGSNTTNITSNTNITSIFTNQLPHPPAMFYPFPVSLWRDEYRFQVPETVSAQPILNTTASPPLENGHAVLVLFHQNMENPLKCFHNGNSKFNDILTEAILDDSHACNVIELARVDVSGVWMRVPLGMTVNVRWSCGVEGGLGGFVFGSSGGAEGWAMPLGRRMDSDVFSSAFDYETSSGSSQVETMLSSYTSVSFGDSYSGPKNSDFASVFVSAVEGITHEFYTETVSAKSPSESSKSAQHLPVFFTPSNSIAETTSTQGATHSVYGLSFYDFDVLDIVLNVSSVSGDISGNDALKTSIDSGDISGNEAFKTSIVSGDISGNDVLKTSIVSGDISGNEAFKTSIVSGDISGNDALKTSIVSGDMSGNDALRTSYEEMSTADSVNDVEFSVKGSTNMYLSVYVTDGKSESVENVWKDVQTNHVTATEVDEVSSTKIWKMDSSVENVWKDIHTSHVTATEVDEISSTENLKMDSGLSLLMPSSDIRFATSADVSVSRTSEASVSEVSSSSISSSPTSSSLLSSSQFLSNLEKMTDVTLKPPTSKSKPPAPLCPCTCRTSFFHPPPQIVNKTAKNAELIIPKAELSSTRRHKTSAEDTRTSSSVIGVYMTAIPVAIIMTIFYADLCHKGIARLRLKKGWRTKRHRSRNEQSP